jgi:hypothetical protein
LKKTVIDMRNIIIIISFIFIQYSLLSQGGSNYSAIGLGAVNYQKTSAYESVGGTSIAFPFEKAINTVNPAMWSQNTNTRLMTGYKFNQHYNQSDAGNLFQNNGNISGINMLFSIDTASGTSFALGIVPYSRVKYYIGAPLEIDFDGDTINGESFYQGKGGLNRIYTGLSFGIIDGLYFGTEGYLNFGTLQNLNSTEIYGDASSFNSYVYRNDYLYNFGYKFGLYFDRIKNFGIGLFFENSTEFNLEREKSYFSLSPNTGDTIVTSSGNFNSPPAYGIGLSYKTGKFIIGADYSRQDFSDFTFNPGANSEFKNYSNFSVGVVRAGNKSYSADYLDKISYKFGISYTQQYYRIFGNDINELSFSFGMTLPQKGTGLIDVAFVFGQKGTKDNGLINEYYGRLGVDISIGETWFVPFKRRY